MIERINDWLIHTKVDGTDIHIQISNIDYVEEVEDGVTMIGWGDVGQGILGAMVRYLGGLKCLKKKRQLFKRETRE